MKILIIEDEKLLADSIGALLTQRGFSVEIVYDGKACGWMPSCPGSC